MAIEEGIVFKMGADGPATAWVKTMPGSTCASCSARHSCNPGAGGKEREVEALNTAAARVGDRIQLSISSGSLLKATFLLYVLPIICMLIGGVAGNAIAPRFNIDPSALAALLAMGCLVAALVGVKVSASRLARRVAYRPQIVRIIGRGPFETDAATSNHCIPQDTETS